MVKWMRRTTWIASVVATLLAPGAAADAAAGPVAVVLGTAQDGGLPHVACHCARCQAARREPALARRVASLGIVIPPRPRLYLIDATPDLPAQLESLAAYRPAPPGRADRAPLDGLFLTHAHMGHILGLAYFGFEALHTSCLPVYGTDAVTRFVRDNGPWSLLVSRQEVALEPLAPGRAVDLGGGVSIAAEPVPHRDELSDTVAFRVRGPHATLYYVPDTDAWTRWEPPLVERLDGVDVALLDGTFYSAEELPGRTVAAIGHPFITATMDLLEDRVRSGKLKVYFIHLNHSNPAWDPDGAALREIRRRGFEVAEEGTELGL